MIVQCTPSGRNLIAPHDQSCDRLSHWTSIAVSFAAWLVCILRASCVTGSSHVIELSRSYVHRQSCVCLLTDGWASLGLLSRVLCHAKCHVRHPDYILHIARLTRQVSHFFFFVERAVDLAFQPLGRVRTRAKVSCIQFKTRQGNFRSARKEVVLILI